MAENSKEEQVKASEAAETAEEKKNADAAGAEKETGKAENTDKAEKSEASDEKAKEVKDSKDPKESKESKKSKKKPKHDKRDDEIAELKDRVLRNLAEFDNFRKRTEKEKSQMFDLGVKSIIEKLLPVIDNFERGLNGLDEKGLEDPFAAGIEKTYKQFLKVLEETGVEPIEAVGKEFNPEFHNAVMHVEDESLGENVVCEEFQKGYMYHDSVVRHSMVKVAN